MGIREKYWCVLILGTIIFFVGTLNTSTEVYQHNFSQEICFFCKKRVRNRTFSIFKKNSKTMHFTWKLILHEIDDLLHLIFSPINGSAIRPMRKREDGTVRRYNTKSILFTQMLTMIFT